MLKEITPYAVSLVLFLTLLEVFYSYKKNKHLYDAQDTWVSIVLGALGFVTRFFTKGLNLAVWFWVYNLSPFKIESSLLSFVILFFLHELVYYWYHRVSHEVPFMWATHVNHHSSTKFNLSVAARTPFLNFGYLILFWTPLAFLGFNPLDILIVQMVSLYLSFIQHTKLIPKLGLLELVFSTPSHHRVHHAANPQYINKNYGSVLIIYDKIFGTFAKEEEKVVFGITKNPKDRSVLNMIFHGWKSWLNKEEF